MTQPAPTDKCAKCEKTYKEHHKGFISAMTYCKRPYTPGWTIDVFTPIEQAQPKAGEIEIDVEISDSTNIIINAKRGDQNDHTPESETPRQKAFAKAKEMTLPEMAEFILRSEELESVLRDLDEGDCYHACTPDEWIHRIKKLLSQ